ncbi:hypothetical protein BD289DRAFT_102394 [Coniella lustricola]|uniref:Uncharacterized protein n=1 Tax=Coniella lustricola TaxID=2025994 RepID=A0A2T3AH23_9PEZI|nr:hypothetical protein BD289DRAFT_102394 [Coniella lustricola]
MLPHASPTRPLGVSAPLQRPKWGHFYDLTLLQRLVFFYHVFLDQPDRLCLLLFSLQATTAHSDLLVVAIVQNAFCQSPQELSLNRPKSHDRVFFCISQRSSKFVASLVFFFDCLCAKVPAPYLTNLPPFPFSFSVFSSLSFNASDNSFCSPTPLQRFHFLLFPH